MTSVSQPGTEFLRVTDLHAFYGESHILHGIDFVVNRGEVVTLLGRNGAGRTTTLRAILGLTGKRTGSRICRALPGNNRRRDGRSHAWPCRRLRDR